MKINKKALELIEKGLTANTVSKLTESQINILHSKIVISEQVKEIPSKKYEIGPGGGSLPANEKGYMVKQDPVTKKVVATASEQEMTEDETDDVTDQNALGATALQDLTGQDKLDAYLAGSGASSIKAAIEADRTLSGAVNTLRVTGAEAGTYDSQGVTFLSYRYRLTLWG